MNKFDVLVSLTGVLVLSGAFQSAQAAQSGQTSDGDANYAGPVLLEAHEANRVGWTKDSDDSGFMDFTLSMQYPILYEKFAPCSFMPFAAFTGRFGQYIASRDSAPVIGKRFNPKFFVRYLLDNVPASEKDRPGIDFVDFEFAHESNGQAVNSLASFNNMAADWHSSNVAKDYISRGWDYVGVAGQFHPFRGSQPSLILGGSVKSYSGGFPQGAIEEYFSWEDKRDISKINLVSGLQLLGKYDLCNSWVNGLTVKLDTGSSHPFKYSTLTTELEFTPTINNYLGVPIVLTYRNGYNSDLTQYFVKGWSFGFALKFETFRNHSRLESVE